MDLHRAGPANVPRQRQVTQLTNSSARGDILETVEFTGDRD